MRRNLYARSIDAFLGLPFNIASYGLLLSLLCKATNRKPRLLIISFGDVHIYNNHQKQVEQQLAREPRKLPMLDIDYQEGNQLYNFAYELFRYDPWPSIKADVAV